MSQEKLPTLKKYSLLVDFYEEPDAGKVSMNRYHAKKDDPSKQQLNEEEVIKAYNYGKKTVPVSETDLKAM